MVWRHGRGEGREGRGEGAGRVKKSIDRKNAMFKGGWEQRVGEEKGRRRPRMLKNE